MGREDAARKGKGNRVTYRDAVSVFLTDAFSFRLALLEGMLVLELGAHCDCSRLFVD